MKTKELIRQVERLGYRLIRANKHYFYSNGSISFTIPRHKITNIYVANSILKKVGIN